MDIDTIMNPRTLSREATQAGLAVIIAVTETVREAKRVPCGALYAVLCDRMDLQAFDRMLTTIVNTKLITREGHELVWKGPELQ